MVIGKVLTLAFVTIFSITVRIPEVGMNLLSNILGSLVPALAEIAVHEGESKTSEHFKRLLTLMASLSMLCCWMMVILDRWFIHLWVGESFFAGTSTLVLALIVMVQQIIARTGVLFLDAKGIVRNSSIAAIVEAGLNIAISIVLGTMMGLNGILLGTIIAALLTSSWYVPFLLRKHLAISFRMYFVQGLGRPFVGVSLMGGALFGVSYLLRPYLPDNWLLFVVVAAVTGVLLGSFVWMLYLRGPLGIYVPTRLRRILRVPPMLAVPV
ncbi:lipopolysaccharide biosynthesis protein [Hymenobacter humi]|uniref:Lipopolysaccharide biosynthesis protein n=1 Tax=Hymenobacter humi TaxID=1411620 RepID=A0ABW2UCJ9_9BACT